MTFDPNAKPPKGKPPVAGTAIVVLKSAVNKETSTGKQIVNARVKIVSGPQKGLTFFTTFGKDVQNSRGAYMTWKALCEYASIDTIIDINDDATLERCFVGVPFKGEISVRESPGRRDGGMFVNVYLRVCFKSQLDSDDEEAIEEYYRGGQQDGPGDQDVPPPTDADSPGFRDSDDIPF